MSDVTDLQEAIVDLTRKLNQLDAVLAPALAEESSIKAELRATYAGVGLLDDGARACRRPLWRGLEQIAVQWGRIRERRRGVFRDLEALWRQLEALIREDEKEEHKRERKRQRQLMLDLKKQG